MTVHGITYRRLAINGRIAAVRCQPVDPTRGLIGSAQVFTVNEVAERIGRGETFEFWARVGMARVCGGRVAVSQQAGVAPQLVEQEPGAHRLLDLPGF